MRNRVVSVLVGALWVWAAGGALAVPPVNDDCAGAIPITVGNPQFGTTNGATSSGVANPCGGDDVANDVWYSYTATSTRAMDFSLCGSSYDTTLSIFDACGGALLDCNDDSIVCGNNNSFIRAF